MSVGIFVFHVHHDVVLITPEHLLDGAAALLSSLAFGLGHAYQGPKGTLQTGLFGLAMAGLYLLTGSIWLSMVLHAVIDMVSGGIGREGIAACEVHRAQNLPHT